MNSVKFGLIAVSSLSLILTACPGGTDAGGTTPAPIVTKYSKIGFVGLTSVGTLKVFVGAFLKVPNAISQPPTASGQALDTCNVIKIASLTQAPPLPGQDQSVTALDAGPELTIKKGGESLAVLKPSAEAIGGLKSYSNTPSALPDTSGATVEIPGATGGFPAVTATLPTELAEFTFKPVVGITKDSTFTWTAPTNEAIVTLSAGSSNGTDYTLVYCTMKDDGEFAFPASTKAEMDAKGFTTSAFSGASKGISKFVTKDDALLIVTASRSSTFVP